MFKGLTGITFMRKPMKIHDGTYLTPSEMTDVIEDN